MAKKFKEEVRVYFLSPNVLINLTDEPKIIKITCTFGNWQLHSFVVYFHI